MVHRMTCNELCPGMLVVFYPGCRAHIGIMVSIQQTVAAEGDFLEGCDCDIYDCSWLLDGKLCRSNVVSNVAFDVVSNE